MKWYAATLALLVAACGNGDSLAVTSAYAIEPSGQNAAIYLDLTNSGDSADQLVGITVNGYASMLHETTIGADGQASMKPVEGIEIAANTSVALRPGGSHIMVMDAGGLRNAEDVSATFEFESHPPITETIPVIPLDAYLDLIEGQE